MSGSVFEPKSPARAPHRRAPSPPVTSPNPAAGCLCRRRSPTHGSCMCRRRALPLSAVHAVGMSSRPCRRRSPTCSESFIFLHLRRRRLPSSSPSLEILKSLRSCCCRCAGRGDWQCGQDEAPRACFCLGALGVRVGRLAEAQQQSEIASYGLMRNCTNSNARIDNMHMDAGLADEWSFVWGGQKYKSQAYYKFYFRGSGAVETRNHPFTCSFSVRCYEVLGIVWDSTLLLEDMLQEAKRVWTGPLFMEIVMIRSWNIWKQRSRCWFDKVTLCRSSWLRQVVDALSQLAFRVRTCRAETTLITLSPLYLCKSWLSTLCTFPSPPRSKWPRLAS